MSTKIYEIIPYEVEALKWEKDNWEEVVEFFKAHNTEIKNIVKYSEKALESFKSLIRLGLKKILIMKVDMLLLLIDQKMILMMNMKNLLSLEIIL